MKKKTKRNNKTGNAAGMRLGDGLFRTILIALGIILVIMLIALGYKVNNSVYRYTSTPNDLLRNMKNGYYTEAVIEMKENIAQGETVEKDSDYALPYALIEYYEAESYWAAYHKAAELEGNAAYKADLEQKAAEYRSQMDDAYSRMGELAFMSEEIDASFS